MGLADNCISANLNFTTAKNNEVAQRLYESLGWAQDAIILAYSRKV